LFVIPILVHRSYQHGLWESQSVALSCWLRVNTVVVESETALGSALQWNPNEDGARGERRPSAARGEASERLEQSTNILGFSLHHDHLRVRTMVSAARGW
jgi:hypothetical protein